MKATATFFIVMTTAFILFYLIGSFIEVSFQIADWTKECRGIIGGFGGLIAIGVGVMAALTETEKKP